MNGYESATATAEPTAGTATNGGAAKGATAPDGAAAAIERIAERLGSSARARAVFGDPVARDGVTVIPVAKARWGFGGGAGKGRRPQEEGGGAGGGMAITPVGYIEVRGGEAKYRPVFDLARVIPGGLVGFAVAAWIVRRLFR